MSHILLIRCLSLFHQKELDIVNWKNPNTPMGTIVLITVFILLTIVLWGNAYLVLLSRGVTQ